MITEDQSEVVDFLASPAAHGGLGVERIDTHISVVFLAGSHAYKLKRAVRFDYVDFSTCERRRLFCEAEVRLNRRTAPSLYCGVIAVRRERSGGLTLDGSGHPVEWLVHMHRFDQEQLFDRLAADGRLSVELMRPLGTRIADFHAAAERRPDHGGRDGMAWVIDGNAAGFVEFEKEGLDASLCARLTSDARHELERQSVLLEERRHTGWVRQCHGDLHLRNIVLIDGQPTLFDGIEFNDEISCIDVFYDVGFLLMDLCRRRLRAHANVVLNGYLWKSGDLAALALLPLCLSCRAAVRAKTSATAAQAQTDPKRRRDLQELAAEYLAMAHQFLHPARPCLIAIGGLSGSGKSTIATALAPMVGSAPGAVLFRSDEIRKQLAGAPACTPLGPAGYTPEMSRWVYDELLDRARTTVRCGQTAIVDAVWLQSAQRNAIEQVATDAAVPFIGCWLEAPESTRISRAARRHHDPSDADARIIRQQSTVDAGPMAWHRIDASQSPASVLELIASVLRRAVPDAAPVR